MHHMDQPYLTWAVVPCHLSHSLYSALMARPFPKGTVLEMRPSYKRGRGVACLAFLDDEVELISTF